MSTTGGGNLKRELAKARAAQPEVQVDVGFKGPVASLAAAHEFGSPRNALPERPAFRASLGDLVNIVTESKATTPDEIAETAMQMADVVKTSYLTFHGKPLGETQIRRKAGTPAAGTQLQGVEGPKLIEHIGAWVDDEQVD